MSYEITYAILGHDITFFDGNLVCPATADFDDPDYIAALKQAALMAPSLDAIQAIEQAVSLGGIENPLGAGTWYQLPDSAIEWVCEKADEIETQQFWSVSERVTAFINAAREENQRRKEKGAKQAAREKRRKKRAPGFVYLIRSESGHYKIGRTVNPEDRIQTFSVKLPFRVEYEHLIKCEDQVALERALHTRFSDKRVEGEWFDLSPEDVAYIKSIGGAA